jgi:hypothetical protein
VRSWELRPGTVWESRGWGTSAVGSHYRATASKDMTVDTIVCVCVCVCVRAHMHVIKCKE